MSSSRIIHPSDVGGASRAGPPTKSGLPNRPPRKYRYVSAYSTGAARSSPGYQLYWRSTVCLLPTTTLLVLGAPRRGGAVRSTRASGSKNSGTAGGCACDSSSSPRSRCFLGRGVEQERLRRRTGARSPQFTGAGVSKKRKPPPNSAERQTTVTDEEHRPADYLSPALLYSST